MKFSIYAAAIAGGSLFASTVASPVRPGRSGLQRTATKMEARGLSKEEKERLKYFHEPGEGDVMGHYDARYFKGVVADDERTDTQLHMIRAYLDFFRQEGLDTWIAHGTLLGWWWNGRRLPWDWDMDTQVSGATLAFLGERYNQTHHKYVSDDGSVKREYLLDVNPMARERERGDGMNIIDARWIDLRNGLFIDITGLSETHPDTAPGVWSCKNYHRYHTSDLYPMRETVFEGVIAKVPYSYDKILIQEYQEKALVVTEFQGHAWDPNRKEWLKTAEQIEKDRQDAEKRKQEEEERRKKEEKKKEEEQKKSAAEEGEGDR
ncbi:hypothetical protein BU26DRAFT_562485 [Trematosphaeria pertusa]|uniref:LicD/FKTN/FKRP nucleotidyltransferase domain-containing protein n=1 Tax=Trematosphaeria pertusa TaxID=390896 RepID=A0A6A6IIS7_9PLEO|nr:uncharacterized protein BU26DRAFT_562485 [Trematosphaeria pertusa]KAF2250505.1 hypothetical protein BU26DRAFT_562485 [Trematosphaeria pertusa]